MTTVADLYMDEVTVWDSVSPDLYDISRALATRGALARSFKADLTSDQHETFAQMDEQVNSQIERAASYLAMQMSHG
jgi:hypothetical protein